LSELALGLGDLKIAGGDHDMAHRCTLLAFETVDKAGHGGTRAFDGSMQAEDEFVLLKRQQRSFTIDLATDKQDIQVEAGLRGGTVLTLLVAESETTIATIIVQAVAGCVVVQREMDPGRL
jgi:hypothetical protein